LGCRCGTLRPSRRHSRTTRLWLTAYPSAHSKATGLSPARALAGATFENAVALGCSWIG
jgi:hypothetical protein